MPRSGTADREDGLLTCPHCKGAGDLRDPNDPMQFTECPLCRGEGRVSRARHDAYVNRQTQVAEQRRLQTEMRQRQQPGDR